MERIILMVIRSIFRIPFWWLNIIKYTHVTKYDEITRYTFIRHLLTVANKKGRVTINHYGLSNLPSDNGYILYPNHQGLFDALAIIETHSKPLTAVSKQEVKNIFFLKDVLRILKSKFIDRDDVRSTIKVMMEVTKEVKEGRNYIIFPEGTRSKNKNNIGEFKGGSFKCAMNAKAPIVPVAIIDSYKAFDAHSIKKVTVQIHYLKPLYYEDYKDMKSLQIADYVATEIKKTIKEYDV